MNLHRVDGVFILNLTDGSSISFKKIWIDELKTLPYDLYGDFIRSNIYPGLSVEEKKLWNKATVSNRNLQAAIQEFSKSQS